MSTDTTTETPATQTDAQTAESGAPVSLDHSGSRFSRVVCLVSLLVGAVLVTPFAVLAVPFAVSGIVIAAGGLFVADSRGWFSLGVALALGGHIVAGGFAPVPAEFMLIGVSATVLGWDLGLFGIDVGRQLGRQTSTRRLEVTHTAVTVTAVTVASVLVYGVYQVSGAGRPAPAVALSVIGLVVFLWVTRR